jgi:ribosome maturation factor RimP
MKIDTSKVTRLEIIDHQSEPIIGRVYTKHNCEKVEIQFQDDNRTLKIFISKK